MNKYQKESFAEKLNKSWFEKTTSDNKRKDILSLTPGNSYVVRLIPNMEEPSKTFKEYYMHGWTSANDGRYVSTGCPTTYENECPICTEYFKLYNKGKDETIELAKNIKRKKRLYANVYVVEDPTNEENNGTVKILSYGMQLDKIIQEAWGGEDADEIGEAMFDFTKNGCNLRIKVEKNSGGFPVYTSSKFLRPSEIDISLDDVLEQIHDLDPLVKIKSTSELKKMLKVDLYGEECYQDEDVENESAPKSKDDDNDDDDDIPMEYESKPKKTSPKKSNQSKKKQKVDDEIDEIDSDDDDAMDDILKELELDD